MENPSVHIEQIRPQLTWALRHQVLYPHMGTINTQGMPEDEDGLHFAAFFQNKLVAVVSLFQNGTDFQFRKFAVDAAAQGKGIGSQLLQHIAHYAIINGGTRLWCNARVTAIQFYAKAGFIQTGEAFSRGGFDYVIMEKPLTPPVSQHD